MKAPKMSAALRKERLADISAKRDTVKSTSISLDELVRSESASEGASTTSSATKPATLPKLTLYAHGDVLKAVRRIAVEDGVQAQVILRRALQDYLATRGYQFSDLATGK